MKNASDNTSNVGRTMIRGLLLCVGLAASATQAQAQDRVWNGMSGNWSVPTNWTPADVPNTTAENALIDALGMYSVNVDGSFSIRSLTASNPSGLVNILNGARLNITANGIANDSTITISDGVNGNQSLIQFLASQPLSGTGSLVLNANANLDTAYLYFNGGGEVVSQAAGHSILGTGNIYVNIANAGTINANANGRTLQLHSQPKSNSNLITATSGGLLLVNSITVTQSGAGRFVADGGTVQFNNATINSGAVTTLGAGVTNITGDSALNGVSFSGPTTVVNNSRMRWSASPTVNNGIITVSDGSSGSQTSIQCIASTSLNGSGTVVLNANSNLDTAYLYFNGGGEVLTQAPTHTIRGTGNIYVNTTNNGLISADQPGKILHLLSQPKTNNATMQAVNGAFLDINVNVNQGAAGLILADNARVRTAGTIISGGTVTAQNAGLIETTGQTDLYGVTFSGDLHVANNTSLRINSAGLVNNGAITVNPTAGANATFIQALNSHAISGNGSIILNANPANLDTAYLYYNGGGEVLTLGSGQTLRGTGNIYVRVTNNGLISADQNGKILHFVSQPKTNNNLIQAINGSLFDINVPVTQDSTASIVADASRVRFGSSTVSDGSVIAQNGGLIETTGQTDFYGVTLSGPMEVANNTTFRINSNGLINNGTITINPTAGGNQTFLQALASTSIDGMGAIVLNANPGNLDTAYLNYNGGGEVLTLGSGQTVRGTGRIYVRFTNNGMISSDQNNKVLHLASQPKTNHSIMRAVNGAFLDITVPITQSASAQIIADNSRVRLGGASISDGSLIAQNAGLVEITGQTDLYGVTLSGPLTINNATSLRTNATGITNNGTITINSSAGGNNTFLQAISSTTIDGAGSIVLNANPANLDTAYLLYNGGGEIVTLDSGQILAGTGRVYTRTVMRGRVAPGNGFASIGQIDTRTSLTLSGTSTLDVEIGGTNPDQYDRITGIGNLILQNGTIRISTVNGFSPTIGQTFDIVSGPNVSGQFCGHVFARGFSVAYLPNTIRVTYGGCVADVDGGTGCGIPDGGVTIDDLLFYLALFEAGDITADVDDGSFTGTVDGGVTIDDLLYYLIRFEDGC